jgi:hypothetical protein
MHGPALGLTSSSAIPAVKGNKAAPLQAAQKTPKGDLMQPAPTPVYTNDPPSLLGDVRDAMSRRDDFDPSPEEYADEANYFEVLAVLEALAVEDEVLA